MEQTLSPEEKEALRISLNTSLKIFNEYIINSCKSSAINHYFQSLKKETIKAGTKLGVLTEKRTLSVDDDSTGDIIC